MTELQRLKILSALELGYGKLTARDTTEAEFKNIEEAIELVKANSVLGDVSESFNEELRGKFFKECTHTRDDNGRTASIIRKIDVAPHDLFEWFKSNVI